MSAFEEGLAMGMLLGDSSGGEPSIKDDTFDNIIANKQEIATLWQDNTFKITLNIWYSNEMRGGVMDDGNFANHISNSPYSSVYRLAHNFWGVIILYKNDIQQFAILLNTSYENVDAPNPIFSWIEAYSDATSPDGHTYWYQSSRIDLSNTAWTVNPITNFEFTTDRNGMWSGGMKFNTAGTAPYSVYNRSHSWSGNTPVLSDWQWSYDGTMSTYSSFDYTRSAAKPAILIWTTRSRFTKLSHNSYQALINELMYAVNTYLGINVEMPVIIT